MLVVAQYASNVSSVSVDTEYVLVVVHLYLSTRTGESHIASTRGRMS